MELKPESAYERSSWMLFGRPLTALPEVRNRYTKASLDIAFENTEDIGVKQNEMKWCKSLKDDMEMSWHVKQRPKRDMRLAWQPHNPAAGIIRVLYLLAYHRNLVAITFGRCPEFGSDLIQNAKLQR